MQNQCTVSKHGSFTVQLPSQVPLTPVSESKYANSASSLTTCPSRPLQSAATAAVSCSSLLQNANLAEKKTQFLTGRKLETTFCLRSFKIKSKSKIKREEAPGQIAS